MIKALILLYIIWGYNWVVMKVSTAYFPPVLFVACRALMAAAVLLLVCAFRHTFWPERKYWPWIFLTGVSQIVLNNAAMQIGIVTLSAGLVAVLNYTMPVFMAILAHFFLNERLTKRKCFGIFLSMAGLCLLMNIHFDNHIGAMLIVLGGALGWAVSGVILKLKLGGCDMITCTAWQMALGGIVLAFWATGSGQTTVIWNLTSVSALLYNVLLAGAAGFFLWNYILQHMEASKAGTAILVVPAIGVLSGILFLGEMLTWNIALGMILILASVVIIVRKHSSHILHR